MDELNPEHLLAPSRNKFLEYQRQNPYVEDGADHFSTDFLSSSPLKNIRVGGERVVRDLPETRSPGGRQRADSVTSCSSRLSNMSQITEIGLKGRVVRLQAQIEKQIAELQITVGGQRGPAKLRTAQHSGRAASWPR